MTTFNLPVGTIKTILDIDNTKLEIPIETAFEYMNSKEDNYIRTMDTEYNIIEKDIKDRVWKSVHLEHSPCYINKIRKQEVIVQPNMKYYKTVIKYFNDKEVEMIVPSYVQFFSKISKKFLCVQFIGKADTLIDYQERYARIISCEQVDFKPTEYYNIHINSSNDMQSSFYFNGIYSYIYYINFNHDLIKDNKEEGTK